MAWTTPRTWTIGELVTKAVMDTHVRDNLNAIWIGTTAGDMAYWTGAAARARLGIGAGGTLMRSTGSAPSWATLQGILGVTPMVASQAAGDLFYASSGTAIARLAKGAARQVLRMNSGATAPEWGSAIGARVLRSTTSQSISNTSDTDAIWNSEETDTSGIWTVGSPTIFTIPYAGMWRIDAQISWEANGTGWRLASLKQGASVIARDVISGNADTQHQNHVGTTMVLAAADQIKVTVYQNSGGNLNLDTLSWMCAYFIGP